MRKGKENEIGVGGYVLEVGHRGGTLIRDGEPAGGAGELEAALRDGTPWEAPLTKTEGATDRLEQAIELERKLTDGTLGLGELEGWIAPMLNKIAELDREGHFEEAIEHARAAQRVLAL